MTDLKMIFFHPPCSNYNRVGVRLDSSSEHFFHAPITPTKSLSHSHRNEIN
jgi:hypothetical protein